MLRFATLCNNCIYKCDNLLVYFVSSINRFDHLCFRNFISSSFDHDNLLSCRRNCQSHVRHFLLNSCRVKYKFAINQTYLSSRNRSVKRDVRNCSCNCRTKHCCKFRRTILIYRKYKILQCNIITIILREQRTHRTVDNTVCQNCILRRLTFTLVKSSRNLTHSVHSFIIFYA